MANSDVSTPSLDYGAMLPYWRKVSTILGGTTAVRQAGQTYLTKMPNETDADYEFRRANAKFTNVFEDIVENLAAKPFSREVAVEEPSSNLEPLIENIDGMGNHLHIFAGDTFFKGLAYGLHWIFVDFTRTEGRFRTQLEERRAGVRPFLLSVSAEDMISVETNKIEGRYQFTHCRFKADRKIRKGYEETTVERIFEYNREQIMSVAEDGTLTETGIWGRPTFQIWEKSTNNNHRSSWMVVGDGTISLAEIPLIPFMVGRRNGSGFTFKPMLEASADLQFDLLRQETALQNSETLSAYVMLAGQGVNPSLDENGNPKPIETGGNAVLYAPMAQDGKHGQWQLLEPTAESMKFLASQVKETINQLRELGRQPLTAQTGNLTVVTTAFAAQKGNSAIISATFLLKDALENALALMEQWMGSSERPEVDIFTDFDLEINGSESFSDLMEMYKQKALSQQTLLEQARRYRRLDSNFDVDEEFERILQETPGDDDLDEEIIEPGSPAVGTDVAAA